ncbi:MAG: type II toxin-antitoxin system VapC family toxin [Candidatus Thorarchaeota archaeon]|nr:type II toxin-antitoxin system VapC family toxin [Candidatus Thorarchaeota archaeon]
MTENIYLDTSALVKRFLEEEGTNIVDSLFDKCYDEKAKLVLSQFNVGEATVVFNKYENRDIIPSAEEPFQILYNELSLLCKLGSVRVVPLLGKIVNDSIPLIFKYDLYIADAIQIKTCLYQECSCFATFDRKLQNVAEAEGLNLLE